jgi:acyl-coenzyme A synthetase/AMP-(fatty) acid ligase
MSALLLIRHTRADAVVAYRDGRVIDAAHYLSDVAALAAALPNAAHVLNFCADRYRFAVGLGAALSRRQITMLLPNQTPDLIDQIAALYSDLYCLTDSESPHSGIQTVRFCDDILHAPAQWVIPSFAAEQIAAFAFTSGSTGPPKPNVKTWRSLVAGTLAFGAGYPMSLLRDGAVLGTVAHQHIFGFESTILLPLQHGLAAHTRRPFYPADICECLENLPRPRILVTTPIHLRALLADSDALPAADLLLCATAPLPVQLAVEAEARFSAPLWEIYGCAEAGQTAMRRTAQTEVWTCLGAIKLRQDSRGTWADGGSVETEVLLGDVIELLDSNRFLLHGRTSDLINIAGKRTSLSHLNYQLNAIAGVRDGVFVMPEEDQSVSVTRLMAFVVAPGLTSDDILSGLRARVDSAFLPRPLYLVDALPRNSTGKLPLEAVKKLAAGLAER